MLGDEKRVAHKMDTYLKGLISNNKPDTYIINATNIVLS